MNKKSNIYTFCDYYYVSYIDKYLETERERGREREREIDLTGVKEKKKTSLE